MSKELNLKDFQKDFLTAVNLLNELAVAHNQLSVDFKALATGIKKFLEKNNKARILLVDTKLANLRKDILSIKKSLKELTTKQ